MPILALGLSHRDAPVELRERLAIAPSRAEEALARLADHATNAVILSTCNRTEVYAVVGHLRSGQRTLTRFLAEWSGLAEATLTPHLRTYWQDAAARHLFRTAAGLDSMIVGEGQVLGQVREAYERALRRSSLEPALARMFERALVAGKRARTETAIARSAVSVSQAAVELARRTLGRLDQATIVVVGTGKMGALAAEALREYGARRLVLMNRTVTRADALVDRLGGEAWPLARLDEALIAADVLLTSAASDSFLIGADRLAALLPARRGRPLVIVDIAVPRNVQPTAGELAGIHLCNVDDLRDVCSANLEQRRSESVKVEAIVEQEIDKYVRWWQAREVAPTIGALVQQAEAIRQEELARAVSRLGPLSDRELNALNALTTGIVNKMLHTPITRLKERGTGLDGKHYLHAVRELFDLPAAEAPEPSS